MNYILQKATTAEAIVNYFHNEIKSGKLKQGDKLPSERIMQEQFGISRFSLREGLARLSALGIIQIIHGKGAFVTHEISNESLGHVFLPLFADSNGRSLQDLFEARTLIEERVGVLAARRRTKKDLDTLQEILTQSEEAINDPIAFGDLDYRFHVQIAQSSCNVFFRKMLDVINQHVQSFLRQHAKSDTSRKNALKDHFFIYECIKKRDDKNVDTIIKKHIKGCMNNYNKYVSDQQNK